MTSLSRPLEISWRELAAEAEKRRVRAACLLHECGHAVVAAVILIANVELRPTVVGGTR